MISLDMNLKHKKVTFFSAIYGLSDKFNEMCKIFGEFDKHIIQR